MRTETKTKMKMLMLEMLTGKHQGKVIKLPEIVTLPTDKLDVLLVTLPGIEGLGRIVPENLSNN